MLQLTFNPGLTLTGFQTTRPRALFLRLGLPSTLIRHDNEAFLKRSSNRRNLKTTAFRFPVDGRHFQNETFRNRWRHDNHVISLTKFSSNTNANSPVIDAFLNFFSVVWPENIWCAFRVKPPFSNSSGVVRTRPDAVSFSLGKLTWSISSDLHNCGADNA